MRVFPSLPLLNFLAMLLVAVLRGKADHFRQLRKHYTVHEKGIDNVWDEVSIKPFPSQSQDDDDDDDDDDAFDTS